MYIYLPDGFILFPKILGGFVESIVTSINGYFLVTVSENGCVRCVFILLWFSWFVCFWGFGGRWLNIESFFLKKLSLVNDFFN